MPVAPKLRATCASCGVSAIGSYAHAGILVGNLHQFEEVGTQLSILGRDIAFVDITGGTVQRDPVAFVEHLAVDGHLPLLG